MFRLLSLAAAFLLAFLLAPVGAARERKPAQAPQTDTRNKNWNLTLEGFFPAQKDGQRRPLSVYLVYRNGKWLQALASAPAWNQNAHAVDLTGLTYTEGMLKGKILVTLK